MKNPILQAEENLWQKGYKMVVGIDEAGRGALAGPVVAAAVTIKNSSNIQFIKKQFRNLKIKNNLKLKDSKKLSENEREMFFKLILKNKNIEWGIGKVSEKIIDKVNIKNAAELAMEKALKNLERKARRRADFVVIDGSKIKNFFLLNYKLKTLVKADEKIFSCAIASIIAKITRDNIMKKEDKKYPSYGFRKHKGYPTRFHYQKIKIYGPSIIHRKTFALYY
jgi:ribonuclease HII